jgi:hypothetical protein
MHPGDAMLGRIRIVTPNRVRQQIARRAPVEHHLVDEKVVRRPALPAVTTLPRLAPDLKPRRIPGVMNRWLVHRAQWLEAQGQSSRVECPPAPGSRANDPRGGSSPAGAMRRGPYGADLPLVDLVLVMRDALQPA